MYFVAQKNWEVLQDLNKIPGTPEQRRFPLVELYMNDHIFIVDAEVEDSDGMHFVESFMIGNINILLNFIGQKIFIPRK